MDSVKSSILARSKLIEILLNIYFLGEQSEELNVVEVIDLIKQQLLDVISLSTFEA